MFSPTSLPGKFILKRKLSENNIGKINSEIGNKDWATIICGNDCNKKFGNFHDKLMSIIDKHAPERSVPINK